MTLRIIDVPQGSPEWKAARAGRVTASRIADVLAKGKNGAPSASRAKYAGELIAERLSGVPTEGFTGTAAMNWGKEHEATAAAMYEFMHDATLVPVGFVLHPTMDLSGCSPDRLCGDDGLVQIKCPNTDTHVDTLLGAPIDSRYIKQIHWELACTGRAWCDFVSFDPRMPADMQLHTQRILRDSATIISIQAEVTLFLSEVERTIADLLLRYRSQIAAE